jgi:hypothetical protein
LPSAIIKSIDVFKGTTADMTEGSLGGSVHIETRNGLDFDNLSCSSPPTASRIPSPKNGRRAVRPFSPPASWKIAWASSPTQLLEIRDFDGHPAATDVGQRRTVPQRRLRSVTGKNLHYDPSIVDPTATGGNFRVFGAGGTPVYASASPIDILTRSAAAASATDCLAAFPALTQTQLNAIPAGDNVLGTVPTSAQTAANNRTAAQNEQRDALQTCLNQ